MLSFPTLCAMLPRVTFHCTRGCYMAPRPSTRAVTCLPGLQPGLLHVTHSGLLCVLRTLIMVACPWLCALCTLRFAPCFRLLPHSLNYPLTHSLFPLPTSVFPRPSSGAVTWHPFRVVMCFAHLDSGCLPLALSFPGLQPGLLHVTLSGLLRVLRTLIMVACHWLCALCTLRFAPGSRLLSTPLRKLRFV